MLYVRQWWPNEKQICGFFSIPKHMLSFQSGRKKGETEERNFVKTTSLLTLEEHFASGFTGEYF